MYHQDNDKELDLRHIVMMMMMMMLLLLSLLMMMMTRTTFGSRSAFPAYQARVMIIFDRKIATRSGTILVMGSALPNSTCRELDILASDVL